MLVSAKRTNLPKATFCAATPGRAPFRYEKVLPKIDLRPLLQVTPEKLQHEKSLLLASPDASGEENRH